MNNAILYIADVDPPERQMPEFSDWFASRHAPDLYRIGFVSCASYLTIDGRWRVCDIYELPDARIMNSAGYEEMPTKDPYFAHVLRDTLPRSRVYTFYRQERLIGAGEGTPLLDCDGLSLLRFEGEGAADDVRAWLGGSAGERVLQLGATGVRLGRRIPHPRGLPGEHPSHVVVIEWKGPPPPTDEIAASFSERFPSLTATTMTGRRLYPWPDDGRPIAQP